MLLTPRSCLVLSGLVVFAGTASSQVPNSSVATDFWLGFLENYDHVDADGKILDIMITSAVSTSGEVSIPSMGLLWPFTVTANSSTVVSIDRQYAMPTSSEVIEPMAVHVVANDPVSVFAINTEEYSTGGTAVIPTSGLGNRYRVVCYMGMPTGDPGQVSEFSIVPTQDNTMVEVVPSDTTEGGHLPGIPFTIHLDAGDLYQVKAGLETGDLTGSTVAVINGDPCQTIAVFSGVLCAEIECDACDQMYEQMLPSTSWGMEYFLAPIRDNVLYTYRIVADQDGTQISVNGGAAIALDAGEFVDSLHVEGATCITGDHPFLVGQYLQGYLCDDFGDPSFMMVSPQEKVLDRIAFHAWQENLIDSIYVSIVVDAGDIASVYLDGAVLSANAFALFDSCSVKAYAIRSIQPGAHVLECAGGFIGYLYGAGIAESYAIALNTAAVSAAAGDSTICSMSGSNLLLNAPAGLASPYWIDPADPLDTLAVGPTFSVTVSTPADYCVLGVGTTGCGGYCFHLGVLDPFGVPFDVIASPDTAICGTIANVDLVATTVGDTGITYHWTSDAGTIFSANSPQTSGGALTSAEYVVVVNSAHGCSASDTATVFLFPTPPTPVVIYAAGELTAPPGYTYQWYFNGTAVPGGTGQILVPTTNGYYSVVVMDVNGCGAISTDLQVIDVGLNEHAGDPVRITTTGSYIDIQASEVAIQEVHIYSSLGQLVTTWQPATAASAIRLPMDASGVYLVKLRANGAWSARRVGVIVE